MIDVITLVIWALVLYILYHACKLCIGYKRVHFGRRSSFAIRKTDIGLDLHIPIQCNVEKIDVEVYYWIHERYGIMGDEYAYEPEAATLTRGLTILHIKDVRIVNKERDSDILFELRSKISGWVYDCIDVEMQALRGKGRDN